MDKVEKLIRDSAIYSPNGYREVDIPKIIKGFELEQKYAGQLSRVYVFKKEPWVIKESKWDIKFEFGVGGVPLPIKATERVLNLFSFTFLPKKEEVMRQFKLYLEFAQYLGYFRNDKEYYHPNRDLILVAQKNIRNSLLFFKKEIEEEYKFKINPKIDDILKSDVRHHNFLPKEYQLAGKSISKANKGKPTSFIFQQFVQGEMLHDVPDKTLDKERKKELTLMIYLILLMHMQIRILPDTRPRYYWFQAHNWLTLTDNVSVTDNGLKFIDTRWFWDTKANFVRRGMMIPNLIIERAKYSINQLLDELE